MKRYSLKIGVGGMFVFATTFFIIIPFACTKIDRSLGLHGSLTKIDTQAGIILSIIGGSLAFWCVMLFFTVGKGTPNPLHPPGKFIVKGPYKYTRNPMMTGVWVFLIGEALLLHSFVLLFFSFFILMPAGMLFISKYEEPDLKDRFGKEYPEYMQRVPRWIPKLKKTNDA